MKLYDVDEYMASLEWPHAISAGCVIYRVNDSVAEVLVLSTHVGHSHNPYNETIYSLPKGHVDFKETILESAIRETEEESGCKVAVQTYLGATLRSYQHPVYEVNVQKTTHYFAGLWQADLETPIDSEHDGREWVSPERAIELLNRVTPERGEAEIIERLIKFLELTDDLSA